MKCLLLIPTVLLVTAVFFFVFPVIKVCGNSMYPTYHDGEYLWGFRFYPKKKLKVGDVVLYKHEDIVVVKRIASTTTSGTMLYCLGDNSPDSYDSRHYGFVPRKKVICRPFSQRKKVFLNEE